MERYNARKNTGCDSKGYGLPGTLSGMQSVYSWLGNHVEGNSDIGGYYYMDPEVDGVTKIYSTHEEFLNKCYNAGGEHAYGTETTPYEQGQYTAWQVEKKIGTWNNIFGDYGSLILSSGRGEGGIGGTEVPQGTREKGYDSVFQVGTRTYKNYKQGAAPWGNTSFRSAGLAMKDWGCSLTSIAVIATGFGYDVTPLDIEQKVWNDYGYNEVQYTYIKRYLNEYTGLNVDILTYDRQGMINQLLEGNPVMVLTEKQRGSRHWYVILSINEEKTKLYVSEVGGFYDGQGKNGWLDIGTVEKHHNGIFQYVRLSNN